MSVSRLRLAGSIADKTLSKGVSKDYARHVAAYLISEGRVNELDSLLRDVQADWAQKGYVEVLARSAHGLHDESRKQIAAQVKKLYPAAKEIIVTPVQDRSVVGGVQIMLADKQLDLSVEARLNKFKQLTGTQKDNA